MIELDFSTVKILAQRPTHISAVATVLQREREGERETHRHRQTDRQTDSQTETETDRQTDRQTEQALPARRRGMT